MIQDSHYLNILPIRDSTSHNQCDPRKGLEEEEWLERSPRELNLLNHRQRPSECDCGIAQWHDCSSFAQPAWELET